MIGGFCDHIIDRYFLSNNHGLKRCLVIDYRHLGPAYRTLPVTPDRATFAVCASDGLPPRKRISDFGFARALGGADF